MSRSVSGGYSASRTPSGNAATEKPSLVSRSAFLAGPPASKVTRLTVGAQPVYTISCLETGPPSLHPTAYLASLYEFATVAVVSVFLSLASHSHPYHSVSQLPILNDSRAMSRRSVVSPDGATFIRLEPVHLLRMCTSRRVAGYSETAYDTPPLRLTQLIKGKRCRVSTVAMLRRLTQRSAACAVGSSFSAELLGRQVAKACRHRLLSPASRSICTSTRPDDSIGAKIRTLLADDDYPHARRRAVPRQSGSGNAVALDHGRLGPRQDDVAALAPERRRP